MLKPQIKLLHLLSKSDVRKAIDDRINRHVRVRYAVGQEQHIIMCCGEFDTDDML